MRYRLLAALLTLAAIAFTLPTQLTNIQTLSGSTMPMSLTYL